LEVIPMQARAVALRERGRLATLFQTVLDQARRQPGWQEPDRRNVRTWRQFVLGVLVAHSTRLVTVSQVLFGQRAAQSVKAVAMGLAYFLTVAAFPAETLSPLVLAAALRHLDPSQVATYRGKAILVLDPTEYPKRSRGRGQRGRHRQHVGRGRKPTKGATGTRVRTKKGGPRRGPTPPQPQRAPLTKREVPTTRGYVDVWAGLVLTGKQFLPLARQLFASHHPDLTSQNRVEEAVLATALATLQALGWGAIVVADRGLGRKELLVRLAHQRQDFVIRVDADLTAYTAGTPDGALLATLLANQPWLGEVVWDRGQEGKLVCQARTLTATIRFSRTGRQDDYQEATLQFVQLVPRDGTTDPLVLATTLPVDTLADVKGVVRVYSWRWAIETGFETMKAWGLERFMVRSWQAIDRLLWVVALAYALLVVALRDGPQAILREQATALLKRLAALGRRLTVGKLAEAIGLDYARHRRAWAHAWLT
jgi:hypothetical protein